MNTERNKFLTEAMGECWHEWNYPNNCTKCNTQIQNIEFNDFSTWEGFGKLWNWSQKQEWLEDWQAKSNSDSYETNDINQYVWIWNEFGYTITQQYMNPDKFANVVYKYLKENI